MKKVFCILCIAVFFYSCDKLEQEQQESEFGSFQKILDGHGVRAIAFDSKGNAWLAAFQLEIQEETSRLVYYIIRYNEKETVIYNSENSVLPRDFSVWDIAVDKNDHVWIGASDGVWKYDGNEFTRYNSQNTAMPEDIVWSIAVDSKNNIWFASCRFNQGGLVKYDGRTWTAYTPYNSPLPTNSIQGIAIDKSDNIWLSLSDYVTRSSLVRISNDTWTIYGEKDLGFMPYYMAGIQFDSKNRLWGVIDYSLSSTWVSPSPHFFIFDGKNTTQLSCGDNIRISAPRAGIFIDNNDYVWSSVGGVWIGERWKQFDFDFNGEYAGVGVWAIKEDVKNRIWFGAEDGIYILSQ